ncbi:MAG TPA: hypothetical protein VIU11_11830 [Nakamurella sp.]
MSIDIRASRAAHGAHESAGPVDPAARLTDLRREAADRRRAGAVLAAAIVAVVIAGSAWYATAHRLASDQPVEPARPPVDTTAVRTTEDFLGALRDARTASGEQLDPAVDRVFSYLADDALVTESFGSPEELRWSLAWERATAWREMVDACVQTGSDAAGTVIECPFTFHGIRSEEMGLGPFRDNNWRFRVRDEKITDAQWNFNIDTGFSSQMWEPFERWVSTTYPDDAAVMYNDASHTHSRSTTEASALWERRTREYAAQEIASREDYRARADAICTSAHARLNAELAAAGMALQPIPGRTDLDLVPGREQDWPAYEESARGILAETVVELRAVDPPNVVRTDYLNAYSALVRGTQNEPIQPGTESWANYIDGPAHDLGLNHCTFNIRRSG